MWPDTGCGIWHGCLCVNAASELFLFFYSIRTDSTLIRTESGWFNQNRAVSADDRNGWNKQKWALNHVETVEINFEWSPNILNLSFLSFILNICYFFCVFFFVLCFVLCFLPSSFFVLWIKAIVMCFLRIF